MPLNIPVNNLAGWVSELVETCYVSQKARQQRGAIFRSLYLTGDENGNPTIYKKTWQHIQKKAATIYSPVDLRFKIAPYGPAGPREIAMGRAGANTLLEFIRGGNVDTTVEDCVEWSLVKGKTFHQLEWGRRGLEPYMVQPETMGVLREDITLLDKQDAFVHSVWLTEQRFADLLAGRSDAKELIAKASKYVTSSDDEDRPESYTTSRQVIIGGQLYPYKPSGSQGAGQGKGLVNWMSAPSPELSPKTLAKLIRLDELWVWDHARDDWVSFQIVGKEALIEGALQRRNRFAEAPIAKEFMRKQGRDPDLNNPLTGHHPFVEICANPLADYFWGWSELLNVGPIQVSINDRVAGINNILRHQEDPSWLITGINANAKSLRDRLRKPGGYHVDPSPGAKAEKMSPDLPAGLWESLHELEDMFGTMGGDPPVTQGRGESGVRAQGHAETLVRMARTLDKKQALRIERQVEEIGGLAKDILRARCADEQVYWVKKEHVGPFQGKIADELIYEPPAPNMVGIPFLMWHLADRFKVSVDSHSSSPAFSHEARELAFALAKFGAMPPEDLVRETHPPSEEEIIADLEAAREAQQAMIKSLPPEERVKLLAHSGGRKR